MTTSPLHTERVTKDPAKVMQAAARYAREDIESSAGAGTALERKPDRQIVVWGAELETVNQAEPGTVREAGPQHSGESPVQPAKPDKTNEPTENEIELDMDLRAFQASARRTLATASRNAGIPRFHRYRSKTAPERRITAPGYRPTVPLSTPRQRDSPSRALSAPPLVPIRLESLRLPTRAALARRPIAHDPPTARCCRTSCCRGLRRFSTAYGSSTVGRPSPGRESSPSQRGPSWNSRPSIRISILNGVADRTTRDSVVRQLAPSPGTPSGIHQITRASRHQVASARSAGMNRLPLEHERAALRVAHLRRNEPVCAPTIPCKAFHVSINKSIIHLVTSIAAILDGLRENPNNVRFSDLVKVCDAYFGEPRQKGTSHRIYRTPWPGDPRVNIQNAKGKAKPYQVRQVIKAVEKLESMK